MSTVRELWLGYSQGGQRTRVRLGGPGSKGLLLGSQAEDLATVAAMSAKEAGAAPIVLDLGGSLCNHLSGHFETFDYRSFLYDSFRLEEPESWHSQLAAAAYAVALDLSSEEEAIINSAMQVVASDGTLLSPLSVHDVLGKVEGFRGFYLDKLSGRIGSLRLFDAVDDRDFDRLSEGNLIVDFHRAPYPQAAELSAALFIAKLLAREHSKPTGGGLLLLTEAHRVFRAFPRPAHSNRLLSQMLGWPGTVLLASEQGQSLNPLLVDSSPVVVCSSDAWHSLPGAGARVLSGSFVLSDRRSEIRQIFVPRRIASKTASYALPRPGRLHNPELTRLILEDVDRYPLSTPKSLLQFIEPEFLRTDVSAALSSLERQGCLILEPKDQGSGPRVFCYTLSDKGRKLLKELRM